MEFDYVIIGQGVCGTFLSWYLAKAGKKILVIDEPRAFSSTRVASGIINPVTGRRVVATWMIEELLPFAWNAYDSFGKDIGATVIEQKNTIAFPPSVQMLQTYEKRAEEHPTYVHALEQDGQLHSSFNFVFPPFTIDPSFLVYLHPLLQGWRNHLIASGSFLEERFEEAQLSIHGDHIEYRNIAAGKIIFCNGVDCFQSIYWKNLPYVFNKGQALIADIPGLSARNIYKYGAITIVPWYDNLWWIGSSYENDFTSVTPTDDFFNATVTALNNILKLSFTVKDQVASLRPAVIERRPFVGLHPAHGSVGILNGMGTKGCSLAPFFADQMSRHLLNKDPLDPLADVQRFHRLLIRT